MAILKKKKYGWFKSKSPVKSHLDTNTLETITQLWVRIFETQGLCNFT